MNVSTRPANGGTNYCATRFYRTNVLLDIGAESSSCHLSGNGKSCDETLDSIHILINP